MHTATPSIGNAAATWAGWAVTAVTAKFYRSQSDSSRPRPPLTGRNLSKPASLGELSYLAYKESHLNISWPFIEQPSSSSLSTTTSSVTSMTSLEHESNDTSASASDYGNNDWDNENWGEMDVSFCLINRNVKKKPDIIFSTDLAGSEQSTGRQFQQWTNCCDKCDKRSA